MQPKPRSRCEEDRTGSGSSSLAPVGASNSQDELADASSDSLVVEVLRRRLAEQQALLQERESRIRLLELQQRQHHQAHMHRHSPHRHRHHHGHSLVRRARNYLCMITIAFVLFLVGRTQVQTMHGIQERTQVAASSDRFQNQKRSSALAQRTGSQRQSSITTATGRVTPQTSKPPQPITLYDTNQSAIRRRHACLERIRHRHGELLRPHLLPTGSIDKEQKSWLSMLLVDPAYHRNVGDHMITLGELAFIDRLQHNLTSVSVSTQECGYVQHNGFVPPCETFLAQQPAPSSTQQLRVAIWHGGGNWGDLWRIAQERRIPSISALLRKYHRVVGMPQSLFYKSNMLRDQDTAKLRGIVNDYRGSTDKSGGQSAVVLTWRERESYELAQSLYPFCQNLLVPDIAFQLGPYRPLSTPQKEAMQLDILLFLRTDLESSLASVRNKAAVQSMLSSITGGEHLRFDIVDWNDRLKIFDTDDFLFTDTSIQLLSLGRVVVCDRLHAAILCYLSGIPFVYIDQMTGKISKTLGVALDGCGSDEESWVARAQTLPEALGKAVEMLNSIR